MRAAASTALLCVSFVAGGARAAGADSAGANGSVRASSRADSKSSHRTELVSSELRQDFLVVFPTTACAAASAAQRCVESGSDVAAESPSRSQRVYGVAVATTRAVVGVEHALTAHFGLAVSVGYAFGGAPYRSGGASFLPLHAEVCGTYWPRGVDWTGWSLSTALCGGFAERDAKVSLTVPAGGAADPLSRRSVDLWLTPGYLFGAANARAIYSWGSGAVSMQLSGALEFPTVGFVVVPGIGYVRRF